MKVSRRVERALERHLQGRDRPEKLGRALRHALFPGGARIRPQLAIWVAVGCGDDRPQVADAVAAAVEFLHAASLVHDDLPCFDDAATRRGRPSVHAAHGEATAVLAGDGLIVLAFQALADVGGEAGERLGPLVATLTRSAGMPAGLVSGQAMEGEPGCRIGPYHAAKTAALFEAAAAGGAIAAGADAAPWAAMGRQLGLAYQMADDLHDVLGEGHLGKPTGQDAQFGRPNAVDAHGVDDAVECLKSAIHSTLLAIPSGPAAEPLAELVRAQARKFLPTSLATVAA